MSGTLFKSPPATWRSYARAFREYSTGAISAELLAALAQVEGSGNPIARTYWRWSWRWRPSEVYRPASSAVGMYQITDGTFAQARRLCIHHHAVVQEGRWNDWHSCWFNSLYLRVVPSHAIELTAAYLESQVQRILELQHLRGATAAQQQALATMIHLCGAGAGEAFAARHFRPLPAQHCGDHDVAAYLARVASMKAVFAKLSARDDQ